ncbi:TIGR02450 family Trp-rich protein [Undibacterium curvum]|uniref:TIGR02450 family Trp-rich protein n=1 Tax=Undibacterium curvum TaxID=2762294 RepID=A0ABR7A2M3_9BURK|nr:TIGR02450 family Trp-rich protein [Undibacterium curvum]MBC3931175.1 TIGR02450 family Trp-rich protein [Undibacterium curvum]
MQSRAIRKLLHSKWTAQQVVDKQKHFIVTKLIEPQCPDAPVSEVEIEAVMTKRSRIIPWRELDNPLQWKRGW